MQCRWGAITTQQYFTPFNFSLTSETAHKQSKRTHYTGHLNISRIISRRRRRRRWSVVAHLSDKWWWPFCRAHLSRIMGRLHIANSAESVYALRASLVVLPCWLSLSLCLSLCIFIVWWIGWVVSDATTASKGTYLHVRSSDAFICIVLRCMGEGSRVRCWQRRLRVKGKRNSQEDMA